VRKVVKQKSRARTIEQMRLMNALCRFVEMGEGEE